MAPMTSSSPSHAPVSWDGFATAEPEFADTVRARFRLYKHHVLATLRKDGSPRVTGLEADFRFGELLLGMMPNSLKTWTCAAIRASRSRPTPGPTRR